MTKQIEIYTDGHCSGNPGPGGWGFVAVREGQVIHEARETEADTTNNRMEMLAVIRAMKWLKGRSARIYSDSQLTVNIFNRAWRGRANLDLVRTGCALLASGDCHLEWIKGHDGHRWNDRADALVRGELDPLA